MKKAPKIANENLRLEKLKEFEALYTTNESFFDEVTQLAASVCETEFAHISLIDNEKVWFKSVCGFEADNAPRDTSFCGHVIASDSMLIVPNTLEDKRFQKNPYVVDEPKIRFYAGVPLVLEKGVALGTLCVYGTESKTLNETQEKLLTSLARQALSFLQVRLKSIEVNQVKEELSEAQSQKEKMISAMLEGFVVQVESGEVVEHNEAAAKILGVTEGQLLGLDSMDPRWKSIREDGSPYPGEDHPAMVVLRTGKPEKNKIMGVYSPVEGQKWIKINSMPLETPEGRKAVTTFSDVTNEIDHRNNLNERTKDIEYILDSMKVGIWKWDIKNDNLVWDDSNYKVFGLNKNDFSGAYDAWEKTLHPDARERALEELQSALSGETKFNTTFKIKLPDDGERYIGGRGEVTFDDDGSPVYMEGINWDKTNEHLDQLELEKQRTIIQHRSKLTSIGELSAGIGHEINNPLAIACGYISILKNKLKEFGVSEEETVGKIEVALGRVAKIVKGLKNFSREDDGTRIHFNPEGSIIEAISMIENLYNKEGITINADFALDNSSYKVFANPGQLQQVFMNLFSNSKDALENVKNKKIDIQCIMSGNEYKIKFVDNGRGIPESVIERIFDPFYTTKEINRGTGIGLSLAYNFLAEIGGDINVKSEVGKGTEFLISIPVEKIESTHAESLSDAPQDYTLKDTGSLNVLVVDDEADLRRILSDYLLDMGMTIETAENGEQAIECVERNPDSYDLIISDIKMPKLNGYEFLKKVREVDQKAKFIFLTGDMNVDLEHIKKVQDALPDGFLYKPFGYEQIQNIVGELFSKPKAS